ncbi:MAG: cytochrome c class I [Flavobacteriales bacterium]|nr:cytochrome c class I [Flavobacteriales bacterium]|tara:strand:- start:9162 stop:9545 length:384 start_codon:yes stop_codon:yes gene_type:complete
MRLFLVLSFVFFWLNTLAQDSWQAPESAKEINNPYAGNKIAAQMGQILYSKLCWTCHGKNGKGDGPAATNLSPKPKDFSSTYLQKQTDGELFWKLTNGKGMMVPYKYSLNEEKRWQLINYIRTLSVK